MCRKGNCADKVLAEMKSYQIRGNGLLWIDTTFALRTATTSQGTDALTALKMTEILLSAYE